MARTRQKLMRAWADEVGYYIHHCPVRLRQHAYCFASKVGTIWIVLKLKG